MNPENPITPFDFSIPIEIGSLRVPNRVFLAPLAGVSDIPFRRICQMLGAGLTYVEMLSSVAIRYNNRRTLETMARHKSENILGVQVTGPNAECVATALEKIAPLEFSIYDLNMGCSVRKVTSAGCGSAILKDPSRVSLTVEMARKAISNPLSVKVRLGYNVSQINIEENAQRIVREGADMLTIHGRTGQDRYDVKVRYEPLSQGIQAAKTERESIVTVGNGDIFSELDAQRMQQKTDCDAIMISRGALGNPWIFKEILQGKPYFPSLAEWLELVLTHLEYQEEHYGNTEIAARLMRKHLLWYARGFANIKSVKIPLMSIKSLSEARTILQDFASNYDTRVLQFEGREKNPTAFLQDETENDAQLQKNYDPKYEMDRDLDKGVGHEDL